MVLSLRKLWYFLCLSITKSRAVLTTTILSSYFESQNAAIKAGTATGENINLVAVGINNGWIDPLLQYQVSSTWPVEDASLYIRPKERTDVLTLSIGLPHLRLQQHLQPARH